MKLALTQRAKLEVRVYGVVVQARREVDGSSTKGKETVTNHELLNSLMRKATHRQDLLYLCNHHQPQSYSEEWYIPSSKA